MTHYLYLHGFQSGPQSLKARETRDFLASSTPLHTFAAPQLSPYPATAIAQLAELIVTQQQPMVLIGSSLGGFYATHLAERFDLPAVLINPAIYPERDLARFLGPQHNPYTGEDYVLTEQHMAELEVIRPESVHAANYWLVLGTEDEVLDWRIAAGYYAGARQSIFNGDDHRLQRWPQCLPALLHVDGRLPQRH
ncbi:YqiA/YcfP family alpha/beta fold hydrolase [Vogesella oryzae]|uniref:YqiA/YcfP family alpha/beta fold hydrolase n=1 Tax=Vogesella oryzae TaxID=1735285 RepID=UPI0015836ECE|nr:YqiA/YcfP family alpha/beta fold hydrolase [Vogesella oryzae]